MISKLLGCGILLGSITLKVPMIRSMMKESNSDGVSFTGEFFDAFIFLLSAGTELIYF